MYGIPNMKLEKHIIDRKIRIMEEEGVKFFTNTDIGIDVKSKKLVEGFDRIVFACGASNPRDINAPGRDAKGIYFAVDFLKGVTKSLLDSDMHDAIDLNERIAELEVKREKLEKEKIALENKLTEAKTEAVASAKRVEELYTQAMRAMRKYSGQGDYEDEG